MLVLCDVIVNPLDKKHKRWASYFFPTLLFIISIFSFAIIINLKDLRSFDRKQKKIMKKERKQKGFLVFLLTKDREISAAVS